MAVQGPPLQSFPVPPYIYESRGGCPLRKVGITILNYLDDWLHYGPVTRAVVRSQGSGAPVLHPVGSSGQLGKEQTLPCAADLFSRCEVGLVEYASMSHERAHLISAGLFPIPSEAGWWFY